MNFKFERLPEFCYQCDKIDHVEKACSNPRRETDNTQYGAWMCTQSKSGDRPSGHGKRGDLHQRKEPNTYLSGQVDMANPLTILETPLTTMDSPSSPSPVDTKDLSKFLPSFTKFD